ncbi:molybdate ABC transporter substrate-binding protein [Sinomonas halotolerans]|uniref:Molybdate ABC transporter substrate-binding protein n=1 Tax=Sinomonas halotolerans TaxID=1644133 RepID=A0ABU9WXK5_9MICC
MLGSLLLLAASLAGCTQPGAHRTLTVFAASSLSGAFTRIGERFEAANPGVDVVLSFAGSSDLAAQITQGAPADVFAAADGATMERVAGAGQALAPERFATNSLVIAVAPGNPHGITGLADLARPGLRVVACAPQVPCGAAAHRAAAAARGEGSAGGGGGVVLHPVSEEPNVTDVLGKVTSGEADAGLVYATDVQRSGGAAEAVRFPEAAQAVNAYPIAALTGARDAALAGEFVRFVVGEEGQGVLADAGFGAP